MARVEIRSQVVYFKHCSSTLFLFFFLVLVLVLVIFLFLFPFLAIEEPKTITITSKSTITSTTEALILRSPGIQRVTQSIAQEIE